MRFTQPEMETIGLYDSNFNVSDDAYTCTLPKDSGSCDNKIFRYYYNAIEVSYLVSFCQLTFSCHDSKAHQCYHQRIFSVVVNCSSTEDAKAMATISSVKFNVFKNVETNLTLRYCLKLKSPRKSVRNNEA